MRTMNRSFARLTTDRTNTRTATASGFDFFKAVLWPLLAVAMLAVAPVRPASAVIGPSVSASTYPYAAYFADGAGNTFCSGVAIGSNWILTAAHCVMPFHVGTRNQARSRVIVGRDDPNSGGGYERRIATYILHPQYSLEAYRGGFSTDPNIKPTLSHWDVALVKLKTSVPSQNTIPLPTLGNSLVGSQTTRVLGFGGSGLQANDAKAFKSGTQILFEESENVIESGDSGGPIVTWRNSRWELVGTNVSVVKSDGAAVRAKGVDLSDGRIRNWLELALDMSDWRISSTRMTMWGQHSTRCLNEELFPASNRERAEVAVGLCNNQDRNKWHFVAKSNGMFNIVNKASGKCLGVQNGSNATSKSLVWQWYCNGKETQEWYGEGLSSWGNDRFSAQVHNRHHRELCWDIQGGDVNLNNKRLQLYWCKPGGSGHDTYYRNQYVNIGW